MVTDTLSQLLEGGQTTAHSPGAPSLEVPLRLLLFRPLPGLLQALTQGHGAPQPGAGRWLNPAIG